MNRDETIALFLECEGKRAEALKAALEEGKGDRYARQTAHQAAKARWNAWANGMLAERTALEEAGKWLAGRNQLSLRVDPLAADTRQWLEKARVDFSNCVFSVRGHAKARDEAKGAQRGDPVRSIPVDADHIDFSGFVFPGDANFPSAIFSGNANFWTATFIRVADFKRATFSRRADFQRATFAAADFQRATFSRDADFQHATLTSASFEGATFTYAYFHSATFSGDAFFGRATFSGGAAFERATFSGPASFESASFSGNATFDTARFKKDAIFKLAGFKKYASFERVIFEGPASFAAIRGESGFTMAGANFEKVPDFIQAHFEEAPRLDDLTVVGRVSERARPKRDGRISEKNGEANGDADIPARWRALKRLAVESLDTDRELEFNAREIQSQRLLTDWPVPKPFLRSSGWSGFLRFWSGCAYGAFSNFGRSLGQPLAWWLAAIAVGAAFYLSQTPALQRDLNLKDASWTEQAWQVGRYGLSNPVACYAPQPTFTESLARWKRRRASETFQPGENENRIGGLIDGFRDTTSARAEALHLAFRNAFIVLDGSSEAAHRTYGCLYGVELYGGSNPVAVVPSAVSTASSVQKLFSALMIFLFGLALRNMLKVK